MKDAKTEKQDSSSFFEYVDTSAHGNHCLIDVEKVSVPTSDTPSVANPLELLFERDSTSFAGSNIVKPKVVLSTTVSRFE